METKAGKLGLLGLLLVVSACGSTPATATFNYDFTGGVTCVGAQNNCYDHFEVGVLSGGLFNSLGTIPIPPSATGPMSVSGGFNIPGMGTQTFSVIMVAKDQAGARSASDPSLVTYVFTVRPGAPTNLVIK